MGTLGVSLRRHHLRPTYSREIYTMSPERQDAFGERMKREVYSSYSDRSTSPLSHTPDID